ncbi:MAG: nucleoside-diphosphate sugar epimerase, partial [Euryarchaeota archaeon]|nr:nucleoside-diphosphate sugar epimerase [Euryarchaeota archaeon]
MIEAALRLPRRKKRIFQLVADIMLIEASLIASMAINGLFGAFIRAPSVYALNVLVTAISLIVFIKLGLYRAVLRYVGSR